MLKIFWSPRSSPCMLCGWCFNLCKALGTQVSCRCRNSCRILDRQAPSILPSHLPQDFLSLACGNTTSLSIICRMETFRRQLFCKHSRISLITWGFGFFPKYGFQIGAVIGWPFLPCLLHFYSSVSCRLNTLWVKGVVGRLECISLHWYYQFARGSHYMVVFIFPSARSLN